MVNDMGDKPVKLGSLTLLLTVVLICLATLSVLALSTARADYALAGKHAEMIKRVYAADALAEQFLADTDDALKQAAGEKGDAYYAKLTKLLPEEAQLDGTVINALITDGEGRQVEIALDISGNDGYRVIRFTPSVEWELQDTMEGLWNGM